MLYVCTGMPRSGSTWVYNAVGLVLEKAGVPDLVSGHVADKDELLKHETVIIKIHRYDAELAAKADVIVTSHRDLRDVAASAHRFFRLDFSIAKLAEWVKWGVRWSQVADYELHYEQLLVDKVGELKKLAAVLKLPPDVLDRLPYEEMARELDGGKGEKPRAKAAGLEIVASVHKSHITDGRHGSWKTQVPPDFVAALEKEFHGWMAGKGYATAAPRDWSADLASCS